MDFNRFSTSVRLGVEFFWTALRPRYNKDCFSSPVSAPSASTRRRPSRVSSMAEMWARMAQHIIKTTMKLRPPRSVITDNVIADRAHFQVLVRDLGREKQNNFLFLISNTRKLLCVVDMEGYRVMDENFFAFRVWRFSIWTIQKCSVTNFNIRGCWWICNFDISSSVKVSPSGGRKCSHVEAGLLRMLPETFRFLAK